MEIINKFVDTQYDSIFKLKCNFLSVDDVLTLFLISSFVHHYFNYLRCCAASHIYHYYIFTIIIPFARQACKINFCLSFVTFSPVIFIIIIDKFTTELRLSTYLSKFTSIAAMDYKCIFFMLYDHLKNTYSTTAPSAASTNRKNVRIILHNNNTLLFFRLVYFLLL